MKRGRQFSTTEALVGALYTLFFWSYLFLNGINALRCFGRMKNCFTSEEEYFKQE